jgi:hypothetical protein
LRHFSPFRRSFCRPSPSHPQPKPDGAIAITDIIIEVKRAGGQIAIRARISGFAERLGAGARKRPAFVLTQAIRMKNFILVLVALIATASPASAYRCNGRHYFNHYGQFVHSPSCGRHHEHHMAVCRDGSTSYSRHHRGTCSRHHGVRLWA